MAAHISTHWEARERQVPLCTWRERHGGHDRRVLRRMGRQQMAAREGLLDQLRSSFTIAPHQVCSRGQTI